MKKKNIFLGIGLFIFIIGCIFLISSFTSKSFAISNTAITINNPNVTSQDLNILVIEINPILQTITNTELYKNNNGHPLVREFFKQD